MLSTSDIQQLGTKLILNFDGVFPVNYLPITHKKAYRLIINTDVDNLSGKHWVAIIVREDNTGYVFDSLGRPPCNYIQNWLNTRNIKWSCNLRQVQPNDSILCGYYCIYYLHFVDYVNLCNEPFANITNLLFPNNVPLAVNDSIVYKTMKSAV